MIWTILIILVIVLVPVISSMNDKKQYYKNNVDIETKGTLNNLMSLKLDDNTLTSAESNVALTLFKIKEEIYFNPELIELSGNMMDEAISEIALEIFKYGMWRLYDKELANHFFNNRGYVQVEKQKIIKDLNFRLCDEAFLQFSSDDVKYYVLEWVLKVRDNAKNINRILR